MRVVTLSRKPCSESSTTANVVEHQAGALNIDVCRITSGSMPKPTKAPGWDSINRKNADNGYRASEYEQGDAQYVPSNLGRWPANVVLVHRAGCHKSHSITVPGYNINRWSDGAKPFGGGAGHDYESEKMPDETVVVWSCVAGCAAAKLASVDTSVTGARSKRSREAQVEGTDWLPDNHMSSEYPHEKGSAARFFVQVQETEMKKIPEELVTYLETLISPPPSCEPRVLVEYDLSKISWDEIEDASLHGMITMGNPEPHLEQIDRALRPGAHLLVIAPDEERSGYEGACAVEDFGYEIRDAIAIFDEPEDFHYVAKPSTSERNAGVQMKVSEHGREVFNPHPTVKPIGIMQALLQDAPKDGVVVDPFMGSGSTGIACLRTGHSFLGIDQEMEYVVTAEQRLRHWDRVQNPWTGAEVESEAESEDEDDQEGPLDLGDLFGM